MSINQYIDHTLLKPTALIQDIHQLCDEAIHYNFAAVCVPPPMLKIARQDLNNTNIKLATVIGFPFGYAAIEAKMAETLLAIVDGADELDIVINLIALKNNDWVYLANELNHLLPVIHQKNKIAKIIIESGILTDDEIIKCCGLYGAAGVDFLKTSTGYATTGATIHAVELMKAHLPSGVQIKAAGGIKSMQFAQQVIDAGATRIGCSSSVQIVSENL
ncbi:MAG: deoxyribose-phosphate aldolase [Bacteroidetes bacterium]|nr:deoxyribose-phosphate aldolase [Bacteroidota bacterium]